MTLLSKELISEVLCRQLKRHNPIFEKVIECAYNKEWGGLHINYLGTNGVIYGYLINLYEFAHKCKQWANSKGYDVLQCVLTDGKSWVQLCEYNNMELRNKLSHYIHGNCEVEAIFKACEWIMEKTK